MALIISIGGVDKTSKIKTETISISDTLNSRNSCSFDVIDTTLAYRPEVGQEVIITNNSVKIFAGSIDDITESNIAQNKALYYQVNCVDYNQLADRHTVPAIYENKTAEYIIKDIIDNYLTGENITYANVATDTPTITKAVFVYTTASDAFNELSDLTGYDWYIDYDKDFHFFSRETNVSSANLTTSNIRNITINRTRNQYRNRQYLRAGSGLTNLRTDSFKGNGTDRAFVCNYPLAKVPTITVNSVSKTVGIRGLDTGKDWYWSKNENEITQDDSGSVLGAGDTLAVTYYGLFPIIVTADNTTEIETRASGEGGTGIYESIEQDASIESQDTAKEKAEALLRRYGTIPETLDVETMTDGYKAGQIVTVTHAIHGLSGQYLIQSVDIDQIGYNDFSYRLKLLSGENIGGWIDFFKKLVKIGTQFVIRENEVLIKILKMSDSITLTDDLTVTSGSPESRVGYALVGLSEVGS